MQPQISFEQEKCIGCNFCISACPINALTYNLKDKIAVNYNLCSACGECITECSENALSIYGYSIDSQKVIVEVLKDKEYYNNSGGGLTLSGGEAIMQFEFSLDLLRLAKSNNIHTVIETSGYSDTEKYSQIMPYVDLFLFDYKLTGNKLHKINTNVEQDLILKNLDYLYNNGAKILIRCPIIPNINDTQEHFKAISELSSKYPNLIGIEILGYHDYGSSKYKRLGFTSNYNISKTVSKNQKDEWLSELRLMGCENLLI
jgi:pyruvate formate lyase activating enzyme